MTPSPKFARLALCMTQAEFAKHLGTSDRMVRKWESGERNPSRRTRAAIALLLDKFKIDASKTIDEEKK